MPKMKDSPMAVAPWGSVRGRSAIPLAVSRLDEVVSEQQ